jgi:glycine cleavage system H protein
MEIPKDCQYTKEHEWVRVEGNVATVGVSDYAQSQLGDVVFLELPLQGDTVTKGDPCGVIESVKAANDIFSPVTGEVSQHNGALQGQPELVNSDCYGEGWIVQIEMTHLEEIDDLMNADQYTAYLAEEQE